MKNNSACLWRCAERTRLEQIATVAECNLDKTLHPHPLRGLD